MPPPPRDFPQRAIQALVELGSSSQGKECWLHDTEQNLQSLELYGQSFGHEQPKSSVPLAASVPSGALICCVLPSTSPLSLPLAAPSEWAYLYQPRGIHRAGVTKVCVTKKRASSLYSKYKIVIFNAPFQTTLQPQDFLISEPH